MRRFLLWLFLAFSGLAIHASSRQGRREKLPGPAHCHRPPALGFRQPSRARAYGAGQRQGLVQDGDTVLWKALDFDAMRKDLTPLKEGKDPVVIFRVFHDGSNQAEASRLLRLGPGGFGLEAGFRDAWVVTTHGRQVRLEKTAAARSMRSSWARGRPTNRTTGTTPSRSAPCGRCSAGTFSATPTAS